MATQWTHESAVNNIQYACQQCQSKGMFTFQNVRNIALDCQALMSDTEHTEKATFERIVSILEKGQLQGAYGLMEATAIYDAIQFLRPKYQDSMDADTDNASAAKRLRSETEKNV